MALDTPEIDPDQPPRVGFDAISERMRTRVGFNKGAEGDKKPGDDDSKESVVAGDRADPNQPDPWAAFAASSTFKISKQALAKPFVNDKGDFNPALKRHLDAIIDYAAANNLGTVYIYDKKEKKIDMQMSEYVHMRLNQRLGELGAQVKAKANTFELKEGETLSQRFARASGNDRALFEQYQKLSQMSISFAGETKDAKAERHSLPEPPKVH